jgi:hypothetical protein
MIYLSQDSRSPAQGSNGVFTEYKSGVAFCIWQSAADMCSSAVADTARRTNSCVHSAVFMNLCVWFVR